MKISDKEFNALLARLREMDSKLWIGICAEVHDQYNEMPFWVLVAGREQVPEAIKYLQKELRSYQDLYDNEVAVMFTTRTERRQWNSRLMVGDEFFHDTLPFLWCMEDPLGDQRRTRSIFDHSYPDEWSHLYIEEGQRKWMVVRHSKRSGRSGGRRHGR